MRLGRRLASVAMAQLTRLLMASKPLHNGAKPCHLKMAGLISFDLASAQAWLKTQLRTEAQESLIANTELRVLETWAESLAPRLAEAPGVPSTLEAAAPVLHARCHGCVWPRSCNVRRLEKWGKDTQHVSAQHCALHHATTPWSAQSDGPCMSTGSVCADKNGSNDDVGSVLFGPDVWDMDTRYVKGGKQGGRLLHPRWAAPLCKAASERHAEPSILSESPHSLPAGCDCAWPLAPCPLLTGTEAPSWCQGPDARYNLQVVFEKPIVDGDGSDEGAESGKEPRSSPHSVQLQGPGGGQAVVKLLKRYEFNSKLFGAVAEPH
ncbi:hypothetical protein B0H10DRAFT_1942276 [Mycena sp. CBHHK59/15]|nr:hypothetical protein B0H10DRAFT_1942276 [Mycena sp. CBHHK59/15]